MPHPSVLDWIGIVSVSFLAIVTAGLVAVAILSVVAQAVCRACDVFEETFLK